MPIMRILIGKWIILLLTGGIVFGETPVDAPFSMPSFKNLSFRNDTYSIKHFGAVANGKTDNQLAIQSAIDSCHQEGGGVVLIPEGKWYTGPIHLKSNICLHIQKEAELIFSDDMKDYFPLVFTRWEGIECYNYSPLIYANGCNHVKITGKGTLNGNGESWWPLRDQQIQTLRELYQDVLEGVPVKERRYTTRTNNTLQDTSFLRPSLVQFINCTNVRVEDVTILSGPMWTVHFVYSQNIVARHLNIKTKGPNNDGITPESSKNVLIEECSFSTGDDCIVIKSGLNEDGWRVNEPAENIVIRNCSTRYGHGGVTFGSEMSGGIKNVYIHDCYLKYTNMGIRFKTMAGRGGYIQDVVIEDLKMDSIQRDAIKMTMNYKSSSIPPHSDSLPVIKDVTIKNISCEWATYGVSIRGLSSQPIKNLILQNIQIDADKGLYLIDVANATLNNIEMNSNDTPITLKNSRNISLQECQTLSAGSPLVEIKGARSGDIVFKDAVSKKIMRQKILIGDEADEESVRFLPVE